MHITAMETVLRLSLHRSELGVEWEPIHSQSGPTPIDQTGDRARLVIHTTPPAHTVWRRLG